MARDDRVRRGVVTLSLTIAGAFDRARRSYRGNLVVSATRVADGGTEAGR